MVAVQDTCDSKETDSDNEDRHRSLSAFFSSKSFSALLKRYISPHLLHGEPSPTLIKLHLISGKFHAINPVRIAPGRTGGSWARTARARPLFFGRNLEIFGISTAKAALLFRLVREAALRFRIWLSAKGRRELMSVEKSPSIMSARVQLRPERRFPIIHYLLSFWRKVPGDSDRSGDHVTHRLSCFPPEVSADAPSLIFPAF